MTSVPAALSGSQLPSFELIPEYVSTAGQEAIDLAAMAGLHLDPWQQHVLMHALGENADGSWAALEVGVVVPRQNGKGSILEARELAGLFILGERLIIHSAHQFDTSLEHYRRLKDLIQNTPELHRRVRSYNGSHGNEGIELKNGQRIRFRTRTKGGGRGFTGDCLILDEAMYLPESTLGALIPTLSGRQNQQIWYTGSAVDQYIHTDGVALSRVRKRGVSGEDAGRLAYFEWTLDKGAPTEIEDGEAADPENWARSNPALGIRVMPVWVENERRMMDHRTFAVERLNVGDWPDVDGTAGSVIDLALWDALADPTSRVLDPVAFAFDVMPDRSWSSIAVAGKREDDLFHVELVDRKRGTGWLIERLVELVEKHNPIGVVCDGTGPAGSLMHQLQEAGIEVLPVTATEHGQACGNIFDAVAERTLRHLGADELRAAIKGASKRPLGDSWAWSRKLSSVDISPLVAFTLALWLASTGSDKPNFVMAVAFG